MTMLFAFACGLLIGAAAAWVFATRARRLVERAAVEGAGVQEPGAGAIERITLGGRRFTPIQEVTIEWEEFVLPRLRRAGLLSAMTLQEGETLGDFALRIRLQFLESMELRPLLGAFLLPDGVTPEAWTPELAMETAEHLKRVSAPGDREKIHNLATTLLIDFFAEGSAYALTSLTSSPRKADVDAPAVNGEAASSGTPSGGLSFAS